MYRPHHFREDRLDILHRFMEQHLLATLVTTESGRPEANHIPVLLDRTRSTRGVLLGHIARGNPLWSNSEHNREVLVLFHGSDAYVSPSSYPTKQTDGRVVPTWNYAVVHVRGTIRWFDDRDQLHRVVCALTDRHESPRTRPWSVTDAPASYIDRMLKAIIGFEIEITDLEGKFKASQNKSAADRDGVRASLMNTQGPTQLDELVRDPRS